MDQALGGEDGDGLGFSGLGFRVFRVMPSGLGSIFCVAAGGACGLGVDALGVWRFWGPNLWDVAVLEDR